MPIYDKAFWAVSFFLTGVLLASLVSDWQGRIPAAVLSAAFIACFFLLFGKFRLAALSSAVILGAGYYFVFDAIQKDFIIPFGEQAGFSGVIGKVSAGGSRQDMVLELRLPYRGRIKITTGRHPSRNYGDLVHASGVIEKPAGRSEKFFEKDGIFGTASFPEITLLKSNQGSAVKAALFKIKNSVESKFRKVFSPEEAAFMSGLTLGETAGFSREFREKMGLTGTSHLVALSGYNIAIIGKGAMLALGFWFSRGKRFLLASLVIALFVVMTGAEASVVRAAIMGFIVLLAGQSLRVYSFRNAIVIAAFLMVLFNPKILVWDTGFQLSFAAVAGLVYLKPALSVILKIKPEPGFLGWRENLWTTVSAQAAVLPILLANFGIFSPISFLTNVLILAVVPITMFLGLTIAVTGFFSYHLAQVFGWFAGLFLGYEIGIINFFSRINFKFELSGFNPLFTVLYYSIIILIIRYAKILKMKNPSTE